MCILCALCIVCALFTMCAVLLQCIEFVQHLQFVQCVQYQMLRLSEINCSLCPFSRFRAYNHSANNQLPIVFITLTINYNPFNSYLDDHLI